jgi:hypothetical protein
MTSSLQEVPAVGNVYRLLKNRMVVSGRSLINGRLSAWGCGPMTPRELEAGSIFTIANPPFPVPNFPGEYMVEVVCESVHYIICLTSDSYEPHLGDTNADSNSI